MRLYQKKNFSSIKWEMRGILSSNAGVCQRMREWYIVLSVSVFLNPEFPASSVKYLGKVRQVWTQETYWSWAYLIQYWQMNYCWWTEFLATDPEVLGSIPGASGFSEQQWVWNGVHSALWGQLRSYLEEIVAAPVKKTETNGRGDPLCWPRNTLYLQKLALLHQQAVVARSA
jgi:hypothetical protein